MEELKMLYNMMGMMKREMDMMKDQLASLKPQEVHTNLPEDIVDWESKSKVLDVDDVSVVAEVEAEDTSNLNVPNLKLANLERDTIQKALAKNAGNRKATAVELGLSERTLYRKIKEYGL